ncbi:hypothetical protein GHT06_012827 [Daphnia sinensis]|uniref:Protein tweety homolog n=1 Tax=Daphnia sinensis TaxID=1820382 RepID=A0AAD5LFP5_9CRUS|nr:hypothetical protein GHT06_012827 [Daphnia sinensis]
MDEDYVPSLLATFYHSLPHVNITFQLVNSTFNPRSDIYLESLGVAASVPAVWLLLTLLVLLSYLLSRCCDKQLRQGRSLYCHRWVLGVTAFICSATVAVGLYGNDDVHNAFLRFSTTLRAVQHNIDAVKDNSHSLKLNLETQSFPLADRLTEVVDDGKLLPNATIQRLALELLHGTTANINRSIDDMTLLYERLLPQSPLPPFLRVFDAVEVYRWPITMGLLSAFILLCLILIFGVIRRIRCLLVMFAVLGLLMIIISWCTASVYVAVAMGMGDACVDPAGVIERLIANQYGADVADYYIHCPVDGAVKESGPFNNFVRQARLNIEKSEQLVAEFAAVAEMHYSPKDVQPSLDKLTRSLKTATQNLATLAGLVDCAPLHRRYLDLLDVICNKALFGLTFMLASALASGLLFTILVWVDSHVWIYLRKRKGYLQVAEADPFLPLSSSAGSSSRGAQGGSLNRPSLNPPQTYSSAGTYPGRHAHYRHTHTPPQTPPFPGTMNGRGSHNRHEQPSAPPLLLGPNNGQYPTLSKSCKTLESSDFY